MGNRIIPRIQGILFVVSIFFAVSVLALVVVFWPQLNANRDARMASAAETIELVKTSGKIFEARVAVSAQEISLGFWVTAVTPLEDKPPWEIPGAGGGGGASPDNPISAYSDQYLERGEIVTVRVVEVYHFGRFDQPYFTGILIAKKK